MRYRTKIILFAATGIAALFIALVVLLYFSAERILNSGWAEREIVTRITAATGGTLKYKKAEIAFFPDLSFTFHDIELIRPETAVHIGKLVVQPQIVPLLQGDFQIDGIRFERPDVRIVLPPEDEEPFDLRSIEERAAPAVEAVRRMAPDLKMEVRSGTLNLYRDEPDRAMPRYYFGGIQLDLAATDILQINLRWSDSSWGPLAVDGRIGYRKGRLEATRIKAALAGSSIENLSALLDWTGALSLKADMGRCVLDIGRIESLTERMIAGSTQALKTVEGKIVIASASFEGPLENPQKWRYTAAGSAEDLVIEIARIPEPIRVVSVDFKADQDRLFIGDAEVRGLDSTIKMAGRVGSRSKLIEKLSFTAVMGRKTIGLLSREIEHLKGIALPADLAAKGSLSYRPGSLELRNIDLATGADSVSGLSLRLDWGKKKNLKADVVSASVAPEDFGAWGEALARKISPELESITGRFTLSSGRFEGDPDNPEDWSYAATGTIRKAEAKIKTLPDTVRIAYSLFTADQDMIEFRGTQAAMLDADLAGSGRIRFKEGANDYDFQLSGKMGPKAVEWTAGHFDIPEKIKVPRAFAVSEGKLNWNGNRFALSGTFQPEAGPRLAFEFIRTPTLIQVKNGSVQDDLSKAVFSLDYGTDRVAAISFSGTLHNKTLAAVYELDQPADAQISGNLSGRVPISNLRGITAQGTVSGRNLLVHLGGERTPILIKELAAKADRDLFTVESSELSWLNHTFSLQGSARTSAPIVDIDMDLRTGRIGLDELTEALSVPEEEQDEIPQTTLFAWVADLPVKGSLRVRADRLVASGRTLEPFAAEIAPEPGRLRIFAERAMLCGVPVPGTIEIVPGKLAFTARSEVNNIPLAPILKCLIGERMGITGIVSFRSEIEGTEKIPDSLRGDGQLTMRDGRIYRFKLFTRILDFLNVTNVVLGDLPEFNKRGMPYDSFRIRYRVEKGRIIMSGIQLNADTVAIAGEGVIDLVRNTTNITLLVSPLRTIDKILNKIPIIRKFRTIISIPVGIHGDLKNPVIVPLSPKAVGSHLFDLMKDAVRLPFSILEPLTK